MGVPAFYRWLSEKYQKCVIDHLEIRPKLLNYANSNALAANYEPVDITAVNPSGLECDNFYVDLNGVIHPCSHPEAGAQPKNEEEMFANVCRYIQRLMCAVRPRKLLYLAIDGVAPRAKMNQQRARRFRTAQEMREQAEMVLQVRRDLAKQGLIPQEEVEKEASKHFDSNVITPGTKFMIDLATYIREFIAYKISTDKGWQGIKVIFSDAFHPGEGEHKIMDFIRRSRGVSGYNPNTVHVLHGLDADLIMLALATHEAHFHILREEVLFGRKSVELNDKRKRDSGFTDAQKLLDDQHLGGGDMPQEFSKPLVRISIPILREYLYGEFSCVKYSLPYKFDFERIIDDIVFMCFFVGNDFLPHSPSLDIRDGALDFLFNVYKRILPSLPTEYLTREGGLVNLSSVDVLLSEVGAIESYIFEMRHQQEEHEKLRRKQQEERAKFARKSSADKANVDAQVMKQHIRFEEQGQLPPEQPQPKRLGRAARALAGAIPSEASSAPDDDKIMLGGSSSSAGAKRKIAVSHLSSKASKKVKSMSEDDNLKAAAVLMSNPDAIESTEKEAETELTENPDAAGVVYRSGVQEEVQEECGTNDDSVDEGDDEEDDDVEDEEEEHHEVEFDEKEAEDVKNQIKDEVKKREKARLDKFAEDLVDNIRLHEAGYKARYYSDKCKVEDLKHGGREEFYRQYIMGLCFVMQYYYVGVPSWKWYFPFHYAPFASDLKNIERFEKDCEFELHEPFYPVEQLLGVLPSESAEAIPKVSRWLMLEDTSPIIDFYPNDVPVDPNGKAMPWLWVVLLPFVDEDRLKAALSLTKGEWNERDKQQNMRGVDEGMVYIHRSHALSDVVESVLSQSDLDNNLKSLGDAARWDGFSGGIRRSTQYEIEVGSSMPDRVVGGTFINKCLGIGYAHPPHKPQQSKLLIGAHPPPPALREVDYRCLPKPRLKHGQSIAFFGIQRFDKAQLERNQRGGGRGGRGRGYNGGRGGGRGGYAHPNINNGVPFHQMRNPFMPHQHQPPHSMFDRPPPPHHNLPPPPPGSRAPPPYSHNRPPPPGQQSGYSFRGRGGRGGVPPPRNTGHSFNINRQQQHSQHHVGRGPPLDNNKPRFSFQNQRPSGGGRGQQQINPNVMNRLRDQLRDTLRKKKHE